MVYDERLAQRLREIVAEREDIVERKMFGGPAFMLSGHRDETKEILRQIQGYMSTDST